MAEAYTEYAFTCRPKAPATEILIAELAEVGFESFDETDHGVMAYIQTDQDSDTLLDEVNILNSIVFDISYEKKVIPQQNWNETWESQFQPIEISEDCRIRASFHPEKKVKYEITINPKMAFGTGHHATTHQMAQYVLEEDLQGKKLLDMGCGTGVLAILASMRGADPIDAIDIDNWSYDNAIENNELNQITNISVYEGDAKLLKGRSYEVILANINRNILLEDMPVYADSLVKDGLLFLSGFYEKDLAMIKEKANSLGLKYMSHRVKDDWTAAKFVKQG